MSTQLNESIQQHYTRPELGKVILEALEKTGKDPNRLRPEDLATKHVLDTGIDLTEDVPGARAGIQHRGLVGHHGR